MHIAKTIAQFITLVVFTTTCGNTIAQQNAKQINDSITIKKIEQSALNHSTIYKTNPFAIFWGSIPYTAEYRLLEEFRINLNQTFTIGASYLGISPILASAVNAHRGSGQPKRIVEGFRFQAAYKYYPEAGFFAPEGYYIGSMISYSSALFTYQQTNVIWNYLQLHYFNITFIAGRQYFFGNVALDMFFGMGYKNNTYEEHWTNNFKVFDPKDFFPNKSNFKFVAGVNIGWGK
jgi:hypothetical protein